MWKAAILVFATLLVSRAPAFAVTEADTKTCLDKIKHDDRDLSPITKATRDQLVHNPGQIDIVIEKAGSANTQNRALIELGIVRAVEYLKCVDPAGYQAVNAYLSAHSDNAVVAELQTALGSEASATNGAAGGAGSPGSNGGGGGGFSGGSPTAQVSPH